MLELLEELLESKYNIIQVCMNKKSSEVNICKDGKVYRSIDSEEFIDINSNCYLTTEDFTATKNNIEKAIGEVRSLLQEGIEDINVVVNSYSSYVDSPSRKLFFESEEL